MKDREVLWDKRLLFNLFVTPVLNYLILCFGNTVLFDELSTEYLIIFT